MRAVLKEEEESEWPSFEINCSTRDIEPNAMIGQLVKTWTPTGCGTTNPTQKQIRNWSFTVEGGISFKDNLQGSLQEVTLDVEEVGQNARFWQRQLSGVYIHVEHETVRQWCLPLAYLTCSAHPICDQSAFQNNSRDVCLTCILMVHK